MLSQKNITVMLYIVIIILLYQTVSLANMNKKLSEAHIGIGGSSAVSFTDDGSAPEMVGGC